MGFVVEEDHVEALVRLQPGDGRNQLAPAGLPAVVPHARGGVDDEGEAVAAGLDAEEGCPAGPVAGRCPAFAVAAEERPDLAHRVGDVQRAQFAHVGGAQRAGHLTQAGHAGVFESHGQGGALVQCRFIYQVLELDVLQLESLLPLDRGRQGRAGGLVGHRQGEHAEDQNQDQVDDAARQPTRRRRP